MVLDVNSGSVHVVDDCVYDVLSCMNEGKNAEETAEALSSKYAEQDITEAREEIQELADNGMLFTKDIYENAIDQFSNRPTVVKALCLHIAHDCNLACRYCFAEEGEYHGRRALMSLEVGKKALDFLIANSGSRRNLRQIFCRKFQVTHRKFIDITYRASIDNWISHQFIRILIYNNISP